MTPGDILRADAKVSPFSGVFKSYYDKFARELPAPLCVDSDHIPNPSPDTDADADTEAVAGTCISSTPLKIDAIFVFNDPRDWALDIQVILDLLLSQAGIYGTRSPLAGQPSLPDRGYQQDSQPRLYFCNPDLLWASGYHLPRLGQGAFQRALEGVYREITGGVALRSWEVGKPSQLTFGFAEGVLGRYRREGFLEGQGNGDGEELHDLKTVYMVGDNPESDILGANSYVSAQGTRWVSALVETGVYRKSKSKNQDQDQDRGRGRGSGDGSNEVVSGDRRYDFTARPEIKPKVIVEDVRAAVNWGLGREGWKGRVGGLREH